MKKSKINKDLRVGLLCLLVILVGIIIFLLYNEIKHPGTKEEKIVFYTYKNFANANYSVYLKTNNVYQDKTIGEGKVYLTQFVDFIRPNFKYQFSSDQFVDIKGYYEVLANVEGYISEEKEDITIWNKQFNLIPKTNFQASQKELAIEKAIAIRLDDYNAFVNEVKETADVDLQTKMSVFMNVSIEATTEKGTIKDNVSPAISIPLNKPYFQITKNETIEKPRAIEETKTVRLPVNKKLVAAYSVLLAMLLIASVYIYCFTTATTTDFYGKHLKRIFKKHGNRFVALDKDPDASYYNYIQVNSIEDLVKIADEIERPIMYKYCANFKGISKFYVHADSYLYVYDLTDVCQKLKEKEPKGWGCVLLHKKNKSQTKDM